MPNCGSQLYPSYIPAAPTRGSKKNEQHQTNVELTKEVRAVPRVNCHIHLHGSRWEKQALGSFCGSLQPTAQGLVDLELSKHGRRRTGSSGCLQLTAPSSAPIPAQSLPAGALGAGAGPRALSPPRDTAGSRRHNGDLSGVTGMGVRVGSKSLSVLWRQSLIQQH